VQTAKDMLIAALDYAGARTAAADFSDGTVFAMAYTELVNAIRTINAEPRYSFGYQVAKGIVTSPSVGIATSAEAQGLATEHWELLFGELGERLTTEVGNSATSLNWLDFGGLVPYRIARVYDESSEYARSDRADVIKDRDLNRGTRQFAYNQDRDDYAILELSHIPSGELTVIAEKQIEEPSGYDDALDMPKNVYKFVCAWLARSLCRRLGNAEMLPLAEAELDSSEKPFLATNERNKRTARINPHLAYARLGNG